MGDGTATLQTALDAFTLLLDERPGVLLAAALALRGGGLVGVVALDAHRRDDRPRGRARARGGARRRGLTGIRLHADTSGLTVSTGARRGPGLVLTFLGGYPAPSLLAIGGALLVAADRAALMLWIAIALLVATLVHVRNAYGVLAVLATGALVGAVAGGAGPSCRTGSRRRCAGSCCSGACARCASCSASDAGAVARPTRTCSARSRGCPGECGCCLFWLLAAAAVIVAAVILLFT